MVTDVHTQVYMSVNTLRFNPLLYVPVLTFIIFTCITRFVRPVSWDSSSKILGLGLGFLSKQVRRIVNWFGCIVVFGPRFRLAFGSSSFGLSISSSQLSFTAAVSSASSLSSCSGAPLTSSSSSLLRPFTFRCSTLCFRKSNSQRMLPLRSQPTRSAELRSTDKNKHLGIEITKGMSFQAHTTKT